MSHLQSGMDFYSFSTKPSSTSIKPDLWPDQVIQGEQVILHSELKGRFLLEIMNISTYHVIHSMSQMQLFT